MLNHLIEVVLQSIWSSLTGGWFYDPHLSIFINTVHMYTWIILFFLPFFFYLLFPSNFFTWLIYTLIIFIAFTCIKLINYQLNRMFDKNKIKVDEKVVKVPKLKLKVSKKRNESKGHLRSILTRPLNSSIGVPDWNQTLSQSNRSQVEQINSIIQTFEASWNASRADSLVNSIANSNQINQPDAESNVNVLNNDNSINLDASIGSRKSFKSVRKFFSESSRVLNNNLSSKSCSLSNSSQGSNEDPQNEANYDKVINTKKDDVSNEINLDDQGLIKILGNFSSNQNDMEENSNRSLFKISEESLHNQTGNKVHKYLSSGKKNDNVKIVTDQFDLLHENKKRSILSTIDTNPIDVMNLEKKNGYQNGFNFYVQKRQLSKEFFSIPSILFVLLALFLQIALANCLEIELSSSDHGRACSSWLNTNSFYELESNLKYKSYRKQSSKSLYNGVNCRQIRRTRSEMSFNQLEKIVKKTTKLNIYSDLVKQDTLNPNSIYESIDGESSRTLMHKSEPKQLFLKQSKTVELYFLHEYMANEKEKLNKKISFLETQSFYNCSKENQENLLFQKGISKSLVNLTGLSAQLDCQFRRAFMNLVKNESLDSVKKKFKHFRPENEYQSIDPDRESSQETQLKPVNRNRAGGRKRSTSKTRSSRAPSSTKESRIRERGRARLDDGNAGDEESDMDDETEEFLHKKIRFQSSKHRRHRDSKLTPAFDSDEDKKLDNLTYENFMDIIQVKEDEAVYESEKMLANAHYRVNTESETHRHHRFNSFSRLRSADETRRRIQRAIRPRRSARVTLQNLDMDTYHVIQPAESNKIDSSSSDTEKEVKKKIHKLPINRNVSIRIPFDHFSLLAMLDKNNSLIELAASIFLSVLVSVLTGLILSQNIYQDIYLVIFCFIVASCYYSLLKSVQPDSSSPIHGFNRLTALSRPVYFCLICSFILALKFYSKKIVNLTEPLKFYNLALNSNLADLLLKFNQTFLLFFPILFTLGLFPQISTFCLTIIEQIDMNLFGGTSMLSLQSSILCLIRSLVCIVILSLVLFSSIFTVPAVIANPNGAMSTLASQNNQFSQSVLFSFYTAILSVFCYSLSRQSSDLVCFLKLIKQSVSNCVKFKSSADSDNEPDSIAMKPLKSEYTNELDQLTQSDPFEDYNLNCTKDRIQSDLVTGFFIFLFIFAVHVSTVFTVLRPWLADILFCLSIFVGIFNNYILPHLRLENPWFLFNKPFLRPKHWSLFEPNFLASLECYESTHLILTFVEKNILNVLLIICVLTNSSDCLLDKFGCVDQSGLVACMFITILGTKLLRSNYTEPQRQYKIFVVTFLFVKFDSIYFEHKETVLVDMFFIGLFMTKLDDFLEKIKFVYVFTAPWQLPWGSAFHAFAQPLAAPHTSLLFVQAVVAAVFSAPLMPLMGSAIFLMSYMRPVKFWEKNYNTKRYDNGNTRLQTQFDQTTPDNENLNSIFYEHLSSVLQKSLCGDLMLGRWGQVNNGDFFVLSSDFLNCLVHIIQTGNGLVTFQLRGLEFKGTYCQQRELEAITEDNTENKGFCCFNLGHLPNMLSFNAAFNLRWVAWSIVAKKYIVDAYRIVDNDMSLTVNFFSLRRTLIEFYIKSAIYYAINSNELATWLNNDQIVKELKQFNMDFCDQDPGFDSNLDTDYDLYQKGVSVSKFLSFYQKWIDFCRIERLKNNQLNSCVYEDDSDGSLLNRFCFAISLVCRRALITACGGSAPDFGRAVNFSNGPGTSSNVNLNTSVNSMGAFVTCGLNASHLDADSLSSFQHGYYTLFKGDIRIQSPKDEWVFNDMDLLKKIVLPSVRMGLRLHQDHFQSDLNDEQSLHESLRKFDADSVICYERDPRWRMAVLSSVPSLLSLRHHFTEYSDQYKIVMLNKNFLSFRVIKINRECVRSFWAGQQHELIFLRNKNQERGSIQNAKQVLRNIINSSCDQPIGYPIYVSPLITSYSNSHQQVSKVIGAEFNFEKIGKFFTSCFRRLRENCVNDCSGTSAQNSNNNYQSQNFNVTYTTKADICQLNINHPMVNAVKQQHQQSFQGESQNLSQLSESTYQSSESNNLIKHVGNRHSTRTDSMIKLGSAKYSSIADSKEIRV